MMVMKRTNYNKRSATRARDEKILEDFNLTSSELEVLSLWKKHGWVIPPGFFLVDKPMEQRSL